MLTGELNSTTMVLWFGGVPRFFNLNEDYIMFYFENRAKARAFKAGKLVDNGPDAPAGRRWGRKVL